MQNDVQFVHVSKKGSHMMQSKKFTFKKKPRKTIS